MVKYKFIGLIKPFRHCFAMPPSLSGTALKRRFLGSHERGAVTQWLRGFCPLPTGNWLLNYNLAFCSINLYLKTAWDFVSGSDCRQSYFIKRKGSGNEWVSRMESAVGIHFRRGKQQVSRLLSRWNLSVYSSVWTSRNPDFDLGVDFVDTLRHSK